jgi:uncharacterized delta-60 repeat protein
MRRDINSKKRKTLILFFILCLLSLTNKSEAQPGTLDVSFGNGGKLITDFSFVPLYNYSSAAIDNSGKIWVAPDSLLIRYLPNGNLDSTFGVNGIQTTIIHGNSDKSLNNVVLIQSDGNVIIAGTSTDSGGRHGFEVARYQSTGIIDPTFGAGGRTIINFPFNSYCENAILQPDGKILLVGYTNVDSTLNAPTSFALARYQVNGHPDSTFGINGRQTISFEEIDNEGLAVAVQTDGKILAAGATSVQINSANILQEFALLRLQANGRLDSSFGTNGKQSTALGDDGARGESVIIQQDNKIVVAGSSFTAGVKAHSDFALVRYQANGNIDSTFGINGKQVINFGGNTIATAATAQPDEKIIVAGYTTDFLNTTSDFALARYLKNGTVDSSFAVNGFQVTQFDGGSQASSITLQQDRKILLCGISNLDIALARYNNDISLPVTLLSLAASKTNNSVELKWQTPTELNNKYFSIERSGNGISFNEIGKINSKGNSNGIQQYIFFDFAPLLNSNYYRLKHVDINNHFIYSKTVFANFDSETNIRIYPNPAKNFLIIKGLNKYSTSTLTITDVLGRVIQKTYAIDNYNLNVKKLSHGEYYLQINWDNKKAAFKFIKE